MGIFHHWFQERAGNKDNGITQGRNKKRARICFLARFLLVSSEKPSRNSLAVNSLQKAIGRDWLIQLVALAVVGGPPGRTKEPGKNQKFDFYSLNFCAEQVDHKIP